MFQFQQQGSTFWTDSNLETVLLGNRHQCRDVQADQDADDPAKKNAIKQAGLAAVSGRKGVPFADVGQVPRGTTLEGMVASYTLPSSCGRGVMDDSTPACESVSQIEEASLRLWHYTTKENFDAILKGGPKSGRIQVEIDRADGYGTAILHLSLQQFSDSKPSQIDAHYGDGIYVTGIRPGSMKMSAICTRLWDSFAANSPKYLDRVKYHFQFEVGDLYISCRKHVFKINTDGMTNWSDVRVVKHGRTKELTEYGSEHI